MTENQTEEFVGDLRLGRRIASPSQSAAHGIILYLGLALLLSSETIRLAGRSAPWTALAVSAFIGLTVLSVVELLGGSGEYGGSYILVNEAMGGLPAFITGWSMLAAALALTSALVRLAAAVATQLLGTMIEFEVAAPAAGLVILAALVLLQLFQFVPRRVKLQTALAGVIISLGFVLIRGAPAVQLDNLRIQPAIWPGILGTATAWLAATYLAVEAVLSRRRQVVDPGRVQPLGLALAVGLGGLVLAAIFWVWNGMGQPGAGGLLTVLDATAPGYSAAFGVLSIVVLVMAINTSMMITARQIDSLARAGALPRSLRRVRRPFVLPLPVFGLLYFLALPLIIFAPAEMLPWAASALLLVVMIMVNITAIRSRRSEPERRRPFQVPYSPLIPSIALALSLVLLRYVETAGLLAAIYWLAAGIVFYFGYARSNQVEAQEGETIFKPAEDVRANKEHFRILVPIGPGEQRKYLLKMAAALAHQIEGEVIPLQIIRVPDPLAIEEGKRTARERNTLFRWSVRTAADIGIPVYPVTRLARSIAEGITDTALEEACDLILIPWVLKEDGESPRRTSILSQVAREAPCDVAVLSYHRFGQTGTTDNGTVDDPAGQDSGLPEIADGTIANILVPTAGGPNAPLAIRLALLWAREYNARVTTAYITSADATDKEIQQGQTRIDETIEAMREIGGKLMGKNGTGSELPIDIEGRIIQAEDVISGIADNDEPYGLVMLGATEQSFVDQVLFGNIPEQVARRAKVPVIIVKRYRGLPRLWLSRMWNAVLGSLPQLSAEEQIELYRTIHRGARPDVDFFVMIGLSAIIATYGLFQNSGAVIIGAMLVAPLFSPLIALSLAIVQGNIRLLRLALESNLKGIALAVGLAIVLTFVASLQVLTPEITSRTQPTLADLFVALASGVAGAYAMARKDVATALPGVAIAAALVPPLAVVGIGIASGDLRLASGSILLLATNLVAIVLAGSIVFLLLGFRPGRQGEREIHLRRGLVITLALFVLITIPLAVVFLRSLTQNRTERTVQNHIQEAFQTQPALEVIDLEQIELRETGDVLEVTIPIYATSVLDLELAGELGQLLSEAVERPVKVRLAVQTLIQSGP